MHTGPMGGRNNSNDPINQGDNQGQNKQELPPVPGTKQPEKRAFSRKRSSLKPTTIKRRGAAQV